MADVQTGGSGQKVRLSPNTTFLVVDDVPLMRTLITTMLRKEGFHRIVETVDGRSALTLLKAQPFDFVLTDLDMPHMSGLELVQAIRSSPESAQPRILVISVESEKDTVTAVMQAGADGFLVKPFSEKSLVAHLEGAAKHGRS